MPQLLSLGRNMPVVLGGGRLRNLGTSDILLWLNNDGMGESFEPYSLSYWHNQLATGTIPRFNASQINGTGTCVEFHCQGSVDVSLCSGVQSFDQSACLALRLAVCCRPPYFFERESSSYVSLLKGAAPGEFYVTYEMINQTDSGRFLGDNVFGMQVVATP